MATIEQINNFIDTIGPIIQKYAKKYGYHAPSAIIAQACCESAFGTSSLGYKYHNYFGMKCGSLWKGASVNMATKEEFTVGTLTSIRDNFRAYSTMDAGVQGYFDFIGSTRYANLRDAQTPKQYLDRIKADGYATSSTYVQTNMNIVTKYNLTRFDEEAEYFPKYTGTTDSIINILNSLGYNSGFSYRLKIAQLNGIQGYRGEAGQNLKLVEMIKNGTCRIPK